MCQHMGVFLFPVPWRTFTWQTVHATIVPGVALHLLQGNF